MNKRQEMFSGYWEECLNGVIYAVTCKKAPLRLLSAAAVAEIVDREVWERRFGCSRVQHGAFLWLRSLEEEDPQLGGAVRQRIRDFRPKAGLSSGIGWPAAVGAASLALAVLSLRRWPVWVTGIAAVTAVLGLGAGGWMLLRSSDVRGALTEAFARERQTILDLLK